MGIRIGDYFEEDYELPEEDIVLAMIDMGLDIKPEKIEEWYQSHRLLKERCRKAEAFDILLATYEQYRNDHTHDLKSTLGTKTIDLMEERYR